MDTLYEKIDYVVGGDRMSMISEQVKELRNYRDDIRFALSVRKVFGEAADTIETLSEELYAANIERSAGHYGGGWIECADRLPTMEECQKNDCRFILDDGNRRY